MFRSLSVKHCIRNITKMTLGVAGFPFAILFLATACTAVYNAYDIMVDCMYYEYRMMYYKMYGRWLTHRGNLIFTLCWSKN